jgi:hypothetical protein
LISLEGWQRNPVSFIYLHMTSLPLIGTLAAPICGLVLSDTDTNIHAEQYLVVQSLSGHPLPTGVKPPRDWKSRPSVYDTVKLRTMGDNDAYLAYALKPCRWLEDNDPLLRLLKLTREPVQSYPDGTFGLNDRCIRDMKTAEDALLWLEATLNKAHDQ